MVWGLIPTDPLSGEEKYYIFAKGTYKVGRKGCDVTIVKDKGVSRVHAEIIVDAMEHLDRRGKKSRDMSTKVRIRDCSKYGTFVTRGDGSKEKVHESAGKEIAVKDGDLISLGTNSAAYRFCFVPFLLYVCHVEGSQGFHSVQDMVLSIGAIDTKKWTDECTHVIVDQFTPVNDSFIDAIVSKKPFASHKWLEVLKESRIVHEIPSCTSYAPTLTLDGVSVAVADGRVRENCLKGYTFVLEPTHVYTFSSRLPLILEVGGAKTVSLEFLDSNNEDLQGESNRIVHVVPATTHSIQRGSRLQAKEMELIRAVISGYLDPSILVSPAIVLSSSSTDETIVADSDAETETESESANCGQLTGSPEMNKAITYEDIKEETYKSHLSPSSEDVHTKNITEESRRVCIEIKDSEDIKEETYKIHLSPSSEDVHTENITEESRRVCIEIKDSDEPSIHETKVDTPKISLAPGFANCPSTDFVARNDRTIAKGRKDDGPEDGCSEVLYSQVLIIKDVNMMKTACLQPDDKVVNFKRFRKVVTQSGNSFTSLVPFAKHPFMNSEYEKEVVRSVEEEKKRKKMEAMAEELFNHEKGKRRGAAGSLHTRLTRR